jgi:hypothetical protein
MKKILLALLLLSHHSYAQLEAGFNYGIAPFHLTSYNRGSKPTTGNVYSATLSQHIARNAKLGVGYSSTVVAFTRPQWYYANPMSFMFLFLDTEHDFGGAYLYLGLDAGLTSIKNSDIGGGLRYINGSGSSFGIHLGFSYDIFKGICANAQIGTEYTANHFTPSQDRTLLVFYTFTLGIHYKLNYHKSHSKEAAK